MCLGYCFAMIEGVWCAVVARFLRIGQCMYGRLLHACQGADDQVLIGVQQGYSLTTLPSPNALPPVWPPSLPPSLPYLPPFLYTPFITPPSLPLPCLTFDFGTGQQGRQGAGSLKEKTPDELVLYNQGSH